MLNKKLETLFHKTIKKVSEDIESMKFNTAIASLMSLLNEIYDVNEISKEQLKTFILLLSPFAPHVSEEIWQKCKLAEGLASLYKWPEYDKNKCVDSEIEMVLQVNGKLRARINTPTGLSKEEIFELAKESEAFQRAIADKTVIKTIYVQDRLLNVVAK